MKNLAIVLAVLAALAFSCSEAQAGNGRNFGHNFGHNSGHNSGHNFGHGFGYSGYGGYNAFNYGVISPYAATFYQPGYGAGGYGGCGLSGYGAGYGAGYSSYTPQILTVAPAYPAFYGTGAYGFGGYNRGFFFNRFIRGRVQAFRH